MKYLTLILILLFFNCGPTKAVETNEKDPDEMDDFKQDQSIEYQTDY